LVFFRKPDVTLPLSAKQKPASGHSPSNPSSFFSVAFSPFVVCLAQHSRSSAYGGGGSSEGLLCRSKFWLLSLLLLPFSFALLTTARSIT
jgi:hypothetical protein